MSIDGSALSWFVEGLPPGPARSAARDRSVALALEEVLAGARAQHPRLGVEPARLAARLGESFRPAPATAAELAAGLRSLHAGDLLLALACQAGDRVALAALDRTLADAVPKAAARLRASNAFVDEVAQLVRQKLLVARPGGRPRLFDYAGRGALGQWLRAAALRVALNLLESERRGRQTSGDEGQGPLSRMPAAGPDPEVSLVKRRYAPEFRGALEAALLGLGPKQRTLLKLYFAQGLTVEEIGRLEGTHKSTISRWLTKAREGLLEDVRARLSQKLKLGPAEFDSLLVAVGSQLHISLGRML